MICVEIGVLTSGVISEFSEGVAWGSLNNGMTFDLPCDESLFRMGDQVDVYEGQEDDLLIFHVHNELYSLTYFVEEGEGTIEVVDSVFYPKVLH